MCLHRSGMVGLTTALLVSLSMVGSAARAGAITDPAGDFIPTFLGTHDGSLDVLDLSATFDGTDFHISATENGDIAAFASGLFVIGFNRGAGNTNFSAIGHGGVVFDSVVTLTSSGYHDGPRPRQQHQLRIARGCRANFRLVVPDRYPAQPVAV